MVEIEHAVSLCSGRRWPPHAPGDQDRDQRIGQCLPLFLAHGALPMDSREVMLTNVLPLSLWLPETDWQVEEVTPFERGR